MQDIYPEVLKADVILMATGVWQSMVTSRLKLFLDRLISLDGGFFLAEGQWRAKDDKFKRECQALSASGQFSYTPRIAGRVAAYFISSKDAGNALNSKDPEIDYVTLVTQSLKSSSADYGMFHADPWFVVATGKPDEDYQYDKARMNATPGLVEESRKVVRAACELARKIRRVGFKPKVDRVNRT